MLLRTYMGFQMKERCRDNGKADMMIMILYLHGDEAFVLSNDAKVKGEDFMHSLKYFFLTNYEIIQIKNKTSRPLIKGALEPVGADVWCV